MRRADTCGGAAGAVTPSRGADAPCHEAPATGRGVLTPPMSLPMGGSSPHLRGPGQGNPAGSSDFREVTPPAWFLSADRVRRALDAEGLDHPARLRLLATLLGLECAAGPIEDLVWAEARAIAAMREAIRGALDAEAWAAAGGGRA